MRSPDRELLRRQCELAEALRAWYDQAAQLHARDRDAFADTYATRMQTKRALERELRHIELLRRIARADLAARVDREALARRLLRLLAEDQS